MISSPKSSSRACMTVPRVKLIRFFFCSPASQLSALGAEEKSRRACMYMHNQNTRSRAREQCSQQQRQLTPRREFLIRCETRRGFSTKQLCLKGALRHRSALQRARGIFPEIRCKNLLIKTWNNSYAYISIKFKTIKF